ncbi:acyloxyacyl hydrolase [Pseudomarimonas arenosa]|uniref:Acyloxyacyl hydrolase n=1 Tax=Pseudomarimonas arenosa TaxID=2774145 RepID=A0AAW3ZH53_9GAMM|nr:acyloxyacyl hydrolase [Pseudomarimonas arenosa]MBD8524290.1 acyloxyacyl hydrolase [Pseudomarimonas arenosa]
MKTPLFRCLLASALALLGSPLVAQEVPQWQGRFGAGTTRALEGDRSLSVSVGLERSLPGYHWAGGDFSLDLGLYSLRQRNSDDPELDDDVFAAAAGLRWRRGIWVLGFSPAIATSRTSAISGVLQFVSTAGLRGEHIGAMLQHISNGSLHGRNRGETMLMLELYF